jgi:hypothetical protein
MKVTLEASELRIILANVHRLRKKVLNNAYLPLSEKKHMLSLLKAIDTVALTPLQTTLPGFSDATD